VIENHLFQVLSNLAMEPPAGSDSEAVRNGKVKVRRAVPALGPSRVVRGQFRGYRQEKGVAPDSKVETFAALELEINSWRWKGVPFYIRAGKSLPVTATEGGLIRPGYDARLDERPHAFFQKARIALGAVEEQPREGALPLPGRAGDDEDRRAAITC